MYLGILALSKIQKRQCLLWKQLNKKLHWLWNSLCTLRPWWLQLLQLLETELGSVSVISASFAQACRGTTECCLLVPSLLAIKKANWCCNPLFLFLFWKKKKSLFKRLRQRSRVLQTIRINNPCVSSTSHAKQSASQLRWWVWRQTLRVSMSWE